MSAKRIMKESALAMIPFSVAIEGIKNIRKSNRELGEKLGLATTVIALDAVSLLPTYFMPLSNINDQNSSFNYFPGERYFCAAAFFAAGTLCRGVMYRGLRESNRKPSIERDYNLSQNVQSH